MTAEHPLASALLHQADGDRALEAAITLLAESGCWLDRDDFSRYAIHPLDDDGNGTPALTIDWEAAITVLVSGELICSSGERAILELAASLATGEHVSLRDILPRIDHHRAALAVAAVAHAAGPAACRAECPAEEHAIGNLAELARMLTVIDEFLRSPHMAARLTGFLSARGHQRPGYDAYLLVDEVSFAARRLRQFADHDAEVTA